MYICRINELSTDYVDDLLRKNDEKSATPIELSNWSQTFPRCFDHNFRQIKSLFQYGINIYV